MEPARGAPIWLIAGACALIILRHHENIGRLIRGKESPLKLGRQ